MHPTTRHAASTVLIKTIREAPHCVSIALPVPELNLCVVYPLTPGEAFVLASELRRRALAALAPHRVETN